jgi:hypothetical protein
MKLAAALAANTPLRGAVESLRAALTQTRDAMRLLKGDAFVGSRVPVTEDRYPSLKAANAAERAVAAALAASDNVPIRQLDGRCTAWTREGGERCLNAAAPGKEPLRRAASVR